jgi:hypothetical protein
VIDEANPALIAGIQVLQKKAGADSKNLEEPTAFPER